MDRFTQMRVKMKDILQSSGATIAIFTKVYFLNVYKPKIRKGSKEYNNLLYSIICGVPKETTVSNSLYSSISKSQKQLTAGIDNCG